MDTIAARAPAEDDDQVARLRLMGMTAMGQDAQAAAEDQRVVDIAWLVENGAVYRGNAHLVAVVAHAIHDAFGDAARREYAVRQPIGRRGERAEAEYVGAGNRLRRDAQHVANHAAYAGTGSAERLYRRGMVVRLDLEGDVVRWREADNAGVVAESRDQPVWPDLFGSTHDVALEQAVDSLALKRAAATIHFAVVDRRLECFV